jgi:hypothetical protein
MPSLGFVSFVRDWQFSWLNEDAVGTMLTGIMLQVTNTSTYHFSLDRARK